jgi:hypothetical protein
MRTIYVSMPSLERSAVEDVLGRHAQLCNVTAMRSMVHSLKTGISSWEDAYKVDFFEASIDQVVTIWHDMMQSLGVNCVWIDDDSTDYADEGYHGCISKHPYYLHMVEEQVYKAVPCSEYKD